MAIHIDLKIDCNLCYLKYYGKRKQYLSFYALTFIMFSEVSIYTFLQFLLFWQCIHLSHILFAMITCTLNKPIITIPERGFTKHPDVIDMKVKASLKSISVLICSHDKLITDIKIKGKYGFNVFSPFVLLTY